MVSQSCREREADTADRTLKQRRRKPNRKEATRMQIRDRQHEHEQRDEKSSVDSYRNRQKCRIYRASERKNDDTQYLK